MMGVEVVPAEIDSVRRALDRITAATAPPKIKEIRLASTPRSRDE
jgi:hypothetical protein